jgi:hypothetical protein
MKHLLFTLTAVLLFGAGCGQGAVVSTAPSSTSPSAQDGAFVQPLALDPVLCNAEAMENDIGRPAYPIAPRYTALPHLGEIYTLLDCRKRKVAETLLEQQEDKTFVYTHGIRLRWEEGTPSKDAVQVLQLLGFTKTNDTEWQSEKPFTLDQLLLLRPIFLGPNAARITEDCIRCG